jgi:hypothetical protein
MQRCNIDNPDLDWSTVLDVGCGQWKTKRMWGVLCRLVCGEQEMKSSTMVVQKLKSRCFG